MYRSRDEKIRTYTPIVRRSYFVYEKSCRDIAPSLKLLLISEKLRQYSVSEALKSRYFDLVNTGKKR
jgi:hypothetical protein